MARQFPNSEVTAVSNSQAQREYIEWEAAVRGLKNLRVAAVDTDVFEPERQFDRIVSVEMFEHIVNWRQLMTRVRSWLAADGRFFMHIYTHRSGAYRFDRADGEDWIAPHFFSGGVMPSHHLIRQYSDLFEVEKEWRWSGTHYQRTHRIVDAALALVLARHRRAVRLCRRQRMGRQPLPHEGGVITAVMPPTSDWSVSIMVRTNS